MFHPISPGCPWPNSALIVQKSGLKHRSSILYEESFIQTPYKVTVIDSDKWKEILKK